MNFAIVSPGMRHDGNTLKERSLGGSETAAIQLAEALAKGKDAFGGKNRVIVFSPCQQPIAVNDVQYLPIQASSEYARGADIDVLIVSRASDFLSHPHNAKVCFLWCHDLALQRAEGQVRGTMYQTDRVLLMSQFQKNQYKEVYGIPDEGIEVIRNGIDLSLFPAPRRSAEKVKGQMVYCARPERGLENLVRPGGIMEQLAGEVPEATLLVAHYDNTVDQMRAYYESLWSRCHELPNVRLLGSLTKKQLYDLYSRSWLYIYPTPSPVAQTFDEISCISAMEAQACGLPFLSTARGALKETVSPGTGILIPGDGHDEAVHRRFVKEVKRLYHDDIGWQRLSREAYKQGVSLGWESVAERLTVLADEILAERTSDPDRVYKHLLRVSDIEMCREIEKAHPLPLCDKEKAFVAQGWAFTESPEAYREHYKLVDAGATVDHFEHSEYEMRWLTLRDFLRRNKGKIKNVLDYGCWIGHQTIRAANEIPEAQFVGLDVTRRNIELAEECKKKYAKQGNVEFHVYDEMSQPILDIGTQYDLIVLNEVLEHVLDPAALIARLEKWCNPGGTIFITVPYGPWEAMSYETFPHRCHLRHYEMNDLMDIFGEKKDVQVFYRQVSKDDLGVPCGHHYVIYTNDPEKPTGTVNLQRKLRWQAPRETVSVCMIAYNAEAMLHRTLKSVRRFADEVIIAVDPKTTDSTRSIAECYGATVIEGLNPMEVGFDEARNRSIAQAKGDWILWIDSDEEILNPSKLLKYLRPNILNAYGVQQHHLSVDPPMNMKPDLPMRLFRNRKGMRFYGVVHEHPETEMNKGVGYALILSDTWIAHDGYLTEDVRRNRFLRNIDLVVRDRAKYPDRMLGYFLWLRDLIHLCRYRLEQTNGSGPDAQVLGWAREAQRLYETRYLKASNDPMAPDALAYYSEANRLLNEGVPMQVKMRVGNEGEREFLAQFRTSDAAAEFMAHTMKSAVGKYEGRYI
jgi:glycosyltransferase involved in cell wall biosynthesis/SAM-dependent methyltransferase